MGWRDEGVSSACRGLVADGGVIRGTTWRLCELVGQDAQTGVGDLVRNQF